MDAIADFHQGKITNSRDVTCNVSTIAGQSQKLKVKSVLFYFLLLTLSLQNQALSQSPDSIPNQQRQLLRVIVNSNQDGAVQADNSLTLREAIEIVNGTLSLERLSVAERSQVSPVAVNDSTQSRIEFNLPPGATTIRLQSVLPPLGVPVVVDGTTQPGWQVPSTEADGGTRGGGDAGNVSTQLRASSSTRFPRPIVALTKASGQEVFRGLQVVSDNVTIRGLSIYGFTSRHRATASTPPGDIFISHNPPPPITQNQAIPASSWPFRNRDIPPKNVLIEYNWLGIPPIGERNRQGRPLRVFARERPADNTPPAIAPPPADSSGEGSFFRPLVNFFDRYLTARAARLTTTSAFGVYVFNSLGTTIRRNIIANHDGSGIITAVKANNLLIEENVLECNGFAGMPDAIRLEGQILNARVVSNLIWDNAGSGIYLFKPNGVVEIRDNTIASNGKRYRRAAIYLMGDEHQVVGNRIEDQPGPGVVVAAFPSSDRNIIRNNQFANLQGLSIDLVVQLNTDVYAYQVGDGPNPRTNSFQRRRKAGNFGIDAPRFISREFFQNQRDGGVTIEGSAQPGAVVEIYRVTERSHTRGPLNHAIATTQANEEGKFSIRIGDLVPGERVSAIATHPQFGTSEPALNALIRPFPAN